MEEEYKSLLRALGDKRLEQIAVWRMEGLSNEEIAGELNCAVRTVERKLERIRAIWTERGLAP
jgi:DNA-binding CsgD family transcriptional regulator